MQNNMKPLYKIAVVGPESTGKSTLSAQLATHYQTLWVPEYAREYLNRISRPYDFDDVIAIAQGQLEAEDRLAKNARQILICDTNLIVIQIWLEHKYHDCPEWIKETIRTRSYDLHFLTNIDMPWVEDPQREHPHLREYLFQRYVDVLNHYHIAYHLLSGDESRRLKEAISVIDKQVLCVQTEKVEK